MRARHDALWFRSVVLPSIAVPLALAAALATHTAPARAADSDKGLSAGIEVRPGAKNADLDLPLLAGAVRRNDRQDEPAGVTLAIWAGARGLRLAVQGFHTAEAPEQVLAFYRAALAQRGTVLDCGEPQPAPPAHPKEKDKTLRCDREEMKPGARVLKVGTSRSFHLVKVKPRPGDRGTEFDLVRVEIGE